MSSDTFYSWFVVFIYVHCFPFVATHVCIANYGLFNKQPSVALLSSSLCYQVPMYISSCSRYLKHCSFICLTSHWVLILSIPIEILQSTTVQCLSTNVSMPIVSCRQANYPIPLESSYTLRTPSMRRTEGGYNLSQSRGGEAFGVVIGATLGYSPRVIGNPSRRARGRRSIPFTY